MDVGVAASRQGLADREVLGLRRQVWRDALVAWTAQRALLLGLLAAWRVILVPGAGIPLSALYEPWFRYDGYLYAGIAQHGYVALLQAAFFPLYPLFERLLTPLALGKVMLAGLLISNVSAFVGLALLRELLEEDAGEAVARRTLWALVLFPTSLYLLMAYTESLFLALSVGAVLAVRRRRWAVAGGLIALATLTRSTGIWLLLPLAAEAVSWWRGARAGEAVQHVGPTIARVAATALLAPAALSLWNLYLDAHFGLGQAMTHAVASPAWQRRLTWPWWAVAQGFAMITRGGAPNEVFAVGRDLLFALLWLACGVAMLRWKGAALRGYALFTWAALLFSLSFPMHANPYDALSSFPRYVLAAFPVFVVIAQWSLTSRLASRVLLAVGTLTTVALMGLYTGGGFLA